MRHFEKNREFTCCDKCFEFLAKNSTALATIWFEICEEYYIEKRPLPFQPRESHILTFLEKNNYIVTLETQDTLFIRPSGFYTEPEEDYFCINYKDHSPTWGPE